MSRVRLRPAVAPIECKGGPGVANGLARGEAKAERQAMTQFGNPSTLRTSPSRACVRPEVRPDGPDERTVRHGLRAPNCRTARRSGPDRPWGAPRLEMGVK